jgi:TonB family protein
MRPSGTMIALVVLAVASSHAAEDRDTSTITGSFSPAKQIERHNPLYPDAARNAGRGGWVRMSFCIDTTGAVTNAVVVDSSRAGEFEKTALAAVQKWKYEPARFADAPIRQCGREVMFSFELDGPVGARQIYLQRWKAIAELITQNRLDEASAKIEALDVWNNYEEARLTILRSFVARARGDANDELNDVTTALIWRDKLEPELVAALLHRSLVLNVQLGQMAAALTSYTTLRDEHADALTEEERRAGDRLVEIAHGDATLATPGAINSRTATDTAPPSWSTNLLRPAFQFEAVTGELNRIDVRCPDHWFTSPFSEDQVWKVPASWGSCSVMVFGKEGTTFKLVEFSKS